MDFREYKQTVYFVREKFSDGVRQKMLGAAYMVGPAELAVILGILCFMGTPVVLGLAVVVYLLLRQRRPPGE